MSTRSMHLPPPSIAIPCPPAAFRRFWLGHCGEGNVIFAPCQLVQRWIAAIIDPHGNAGTRNRSYLVGTDLRLAD
jgi:hypothetical protein